MTNEPEICGQTHPSRDGVICTKLEGHEGRHGRREMPMRCIMWDKHLALASARDRK